MWNYLVCFICIIALLVVVILLVRKWHESYLKYLISFLINEDHKWYDKLWRLLRAYCVLGGILAVALSLIKTDFDVVAAKNYFYLFFLSSCFFLFIARAYTTTELISTEPNVRRITRHMNHINFLAFFGTVTGVLELLILVSQNPEIRTQWTEAKYIVEIEPLGFSLLIGGIIAIPLFFSVLELSLVVVRKFCWVHAP